MDLLTFTEEILNGKLHFLCSDFMIKQPCRQTALHISIYSKQYPANNFRLHKVEYLHLSKYCLCIKDKKWRFSVLVPPIDALNLRIHKQFSFADFHFLLIDLHLLIDAYDNLSNFTNVVMFCVSFILKTAWRKLFWVKRILRIRLQSISWLNQLLEVQAWEKHRLT